MHCFIYKGKRRQDTYLYIAKDGDFTHVPQSLQVLLGPLEKVMALQLNESTKLVNADVKTVIEQLNDQGYYLQMPPAAEIGHALKPDLSSR